MTRIADMTDSQIERRIEKQNRRTNRQNLHNRLERILHRTPWGYRATFGSIRAGAKLLAARIVAAKLQESRKVHV